MPQFIEADVIQKIATPAEWATLLGTKIPYKGQIMLVSDGTGKVINIKVGDGTNNFASLEYMFDTIQANVNYVPVSTNSLPTPSINNAFSIVGDGTYTKTGQPNIVVPAGDLGIIFWDGAIWTLTDSIQLPQAQADGIISSGETLPPNGDKVWNYIKDTIKVSTVKSGNNILNGLISSDFLPDRGLLSNGNTAAATGFNTLKLYLPLSSGVYTTNIYLTAATNLITYDEDFKIVNTYNTKGSSNGSVSWSFTLGANEKYIKYCYSNGQIAPYITTTSDIIAFLPTKLIESNILYKLFVQATDYDKIGTAAARFRPFLGNITKAGLDPRAYISINLVQGTVEQLKNGANWKDLYVVYQRFMTLDGQTNTIFQIGEKVGTSVGVNLNLVAQFSGALSEGSDGQITLELNQSNNSGLRFAVTINTRYLRSLVDTNTDLGGTVQLNTRYFENQAIEWKNVNVQIARQKRFLLAPFNDSFNYRSIVSVEPVNVSINDLKGLDLYIYFLRFKGFDSPTTTTIIQISKLVSGTHTVVATCSLDESIDADGLFTANLTPTADSNLWFKVTIDTKYLIQGTDTLQVLGNKVRLDVPALISLLPGYYNSKTIVGFGDSTNEFNTSINFSRNLGARYINVGIGGSRLAQHSESHYDKLSFYNLANAIESNNWTEVDAAVLWLKDNKADDNTAIIARLKSVDFTKVDFITLNYGTNDFTGSNAVGDLSLSNLDTTTTAGALNYGLKMILTKYPNLKVYVRTPTHRFFLKDWIPGDSTLYDSDLATNQAGNYLIQYVDAIKGMSELNHAPCKDMYREGQFNKYNHNLYFGDGVHPNALGYQMIDMMFARFIESNMTV